MTETRKCKDCNISLPSSIGRGRGTATFLCAEHRLRRRKIQLAKASAITYIRRRSLYQENAWKRKYGITPEIYKALWISQNGECRVCGRPESEQKGKLSVDHDHQTNQIRSLLCKRCNSGIGLLGDSISGLLAAVRYLETWKEA